MQHITTLPTSMAQRQADARAVALVRILVGVASIGNVLEHWAALGRLTAPVVVKMPYVAWLPYPSQSLVPLVIGVWLVAALLFIIGLHTRVAGALLAGVMVYVLLLDQQLYSNHLYLAILVVMLLSIADSGARFSLDARHRGGHDWIAAWPVELLKIELSIVYFFAALTKLNPAYLSGQIMAQFVHVDTPGLYPAAWPLMPLMQALAIASIATEFFLAFALWFAGWRWLALAAGLALHLAIIFTGGATLGVPDIPLTVFAVLIMAPYLLFFRLPPPRVGSG